MLIPANAKEGAAVQPGIVIPVAIDLFEARFAHVRDSLLDVALAELKRQSSAKK